MKPHLLGAALAALVVTGVPGAGASTKTDLNEFPAEQRQLTESEKANRLFRRSYLEVVVLLRGLLIF